MTLDRVVSRRALVENSPETSIGARLAPSEDLSIAQPTAVSRAIPTILRLPSVQAETGYSRSTIYLRISQGLWTRPVSLGARSVGWPASEVAAINAARIAGKTGSDLRDLVATLEAARGAFRQ